MLPTRLIFPSCASLTTSLLDMNSGYLAAYFTWKTCNSWLIKKIKNHVSGVGGIRATSSHHQYGWFISITNKLKAVKAMGGPAKRFRKRFSCNRVRFIRSKRLNDKKLPLNKLIVNMKYFSHLHRDFIVTAWN